LAKLTVLAEPFDSVHTVCCECRLANDAAQVDVAFALIAGPEPAELASRLRQRFVGDVQWLRFCNFLESWSLLRSDWACYVPFVSAAFDIGSLEVLPAPCVSLCVEPDFFARRLGFPAQPALTRAQLLGVLSGCHDELCGTPAPAVACERLGLLQDFAARGGVRIKHLSLMMSRPRQPVKVDMALRLAQLPEVLALLAWPPGGSEPLIERVRHLLPWDARVQLNILINPEPTYPLELELCADDADQSVDRWALLERMLSAELCSEVEANALEQLQFSATVETEHGRTLSMSWYIKLRFWESKRCDAKAYLGLMPRTRTSSAQITLR
jgi:hypothetical protein